MTTIIKNQASTVVVTLKANGAPVPIVVGSAVTAQLFDIVTGAALAPARALTSTDAGANWPAGQVAVLLTADDVAAVAPPDAMLAITVNGKAYRFRLLVELANSAATKSQLFIRDFAIEEFRQDRLYAIAQTLLPGITVSDDYIWSKIVAAESEIARTLRVKLVPTQMYCRTPTDAEIEALGAMPWAEESAYDYDPDMLHGDKWGMIITRQRPIISASALRYVYPSQTPYSYDIPIEWLRMDKKYGQVRIVPSSIAAMALSGSFMMQLIGAGRAMPHVMQLTYVAGMENAARDYPELLDVIKKMAVLKVVEDSFLPSSGSISADGLSQSLSVDVGKYHEMIDMILNGPPGTNGGLMTAIHGVRLGVA